MTTSPLSLTWSIFEEPPNNMDMHAGALLVNWNGSTGRDIYDMARSYRAAAFRLLDAACDNDESWESIDPILFCLRHTLELHLKALQPQGFRRIHPLRDLADELHRRLQGRYRSDHLEWLRDRILEFDRVDFRATSFRYHDVTEPDREPELWVDFVRLRIIMEAIFDGLESVRLDFVGESKGWGAP